MELATGASPTFDKEAFLAGKQTPVFFGSGVNNFGVMEVLDALIDLAPSPGPRTSSFIVNKQPVVKSAARRRSLQRRGVQGAGEYGCQPPRPHCVCAHGIGQIHTRHETQGHAHRQGAAPHQSVVTFMSQRREAVEEAYAGDIVGFTTHGGVQLGDTITDGSVNLLYTGLPFFAPEMFMTVVLRNPLRTKQLQQGLAQLGEEGAIQVFRPEIGGNMLLGAVGQLQFEVVQHRLKGEYDADIAWKAASTPARAGSLPTRRRTEGLLRRLPHAHGA
jgi:peptide chain release factor 3